jgi:hypothetical protein
LEEVEEEFLGQWAAPFGLGNAALSDMHLTVAEEINPKAWERCDGLSTAPDFVQTSPS